APPRAVDPYSSTLSREPGLGGGLTPGVPPGRLQRMNVDRVNDGCRHAAMLSVVTPTAMAAAAQ
ncbi:hypothetical protein AB0I84_30210, partial [Streptomyces spectabilis]|uniref:hypothetical protein n=1 Tax=Streptomyces spectabilis TaxID=68270 RepID=UPI0033E1AE59